MDLSVEIDLCKCASVGCKEFLGFAPCPPPFFYHEFAEYAHSRGLHRGQVCAVACRCMSQYPTGNSSEIIASLCLPTTVPPSTTTATTTTTPVTSTTTPVTPTSSPSSSPTTPTTHTSAVTSTVPPPNPCDVACVIGVVCGVVIIFAIIGLILLFKCRGQIHRVRTYCLPTCEEGTDDRSGLVTENHKDISVYYVNSSNAVLIHIHEDKTVTDGDCSMRRDVLEFEMLHTQKGNPMINDGFIEDEQEDYRGSKSDTSENTDSSSVDDIRGKLTINYSETNSLITQVSATLEMQGNSEIGNRTETSGPDETDTSEQNNRAEESSGTEDEQENVDNVDGDSSDTLEGDSGEEKMQQGNTINGDYERNIKTGDGAEGVATDVQECDAKAVPDNSDSEWTPC